MGIHWKNEEQISKKEYMKATGLSERTINRIIKSLKEKEILHRIGTKNNSI